MRRTSGLKCPYCGRQTAYLEFGTAKRRDGELWRYRQKFCGSCPYQGAKRFTIPDARYQELMKERQAWQGVA